MNLSDYAAQVGRIKRLSHAEQAICRQVVVRLTELGDRESAKAANQLLWEQSLGIVLFIYNKLQAKGKLPTVDWNDMDAIQEGNVAAGKALQTWQPDRGTLGTWLIPAVRGAILNYANTHNNGGIGSKHNSLIQESMDDYVDSEEIPEAQDNPGMEAAEAITRADALVYPNAVSAERQVTRDQLHKVIAGLPNPFWAPMAGKYIEGLSEDVLANGLEVSKETIRRWLRAGELLVAAQLTKT